MFSGVHISAGFSKPPGNVSAITGTFHSAHSAINRDRYGSVSDSYTEPGVPMLPTASAPTRNAS